MRFSVDLAGAAYAATRVHHRLAVPPHGRLERSRSSRDFKGFQFTDDAVPRAYDEVLVPRLFEPWALQLLDECNLRPNAVVLDVATGPGSPSSVRCFPQHVAKSG